MESSAQSIPIDSKPAEFHQKEVLSIAVGHFTNDTFTSFLPALLPVLIEKMSLSLTLAGTLTGILQLPAILNPFIGYLADKLSVRYFIIFAPAITASLISMMGLAPNYWLLALLLLMVGVSVASFHAPAPAMIAQISGKQVTHGMGIFMASGELGRSIGPLLAVWAISLWKLEGLPRLMVLGWATSLILLWRFRSLPVHPEKPNHFADILPKIKKIFPILFAILLLRDFLLASLAVFLPTFLNRGGSSLQISGSALTIFDLAGVVGALSSGWLSERFGHKIMLAYSLTATSLLTVLFIHMNGFWRAPILVLIGFSALVSSPIFLAIVQNHFPENRATANGLYMSMAFLIRPFTTIGVSLIGDMWSLSAAYLIAAAIALLAIPIISRLPESM